MQPGIDLTLNPIDPAHRIRVGVELIAGKF